MANLRIYLKEAFRWNYTLLDREVCIGRSRENHIVLPHPEVSRQHAVVQRRGNQYIALDRSGKGLNLNGNTASEIILQEGDLIQVGAFGLGFELEHSEGKPSDTMTWETTLDLPRQCLEKDAPLG
jgi:pSer/pThr/pTyr-binding forkhead associated (FHA) protein